MKKIITNIDRHGRMLIPTQLRKKFNLMPGDKITIEVDEDTLSIKNTNQLIDDMHDIFTKNSSADSDGIVDDFINSKREEFQIEIERSKK